MKFIKMYHSKKLDISFIISVAIVFYNLGLKSIIVKFFEIVQIRRYLFFFTDYFLILYPIKIK